MYQIMHANTYVHTCVHTLLTEHFLTLPSMEGSTLSSFRPRSSLMSCAPVKMAMSCTHTHTHTHKHVSLELLLGWLCPAHTHTQTTHTPTHTWDWAWLKEFDACICHVCIYQTHKSPQYALTQTYTHTYTYTNIHMIPGGLPCGCRQIRVPWHSIPWDHHGACWQWIPPEPRSQLIKFPQI